jgi:hypothetical protein
LRKISELNNTVILQQKELSDRDYQLEISKQYLLDNKISMENK